MANNIKHIDSIKYNKHLNLNERINISSLIETNRTKDGSLTITLKKIGEILEKDPTTISKEVKNNVEGFVYKRRDYKYTKNYCKICAKKEHCNKKLIIGNDQGPCSDFHNKFCKHTIKFPYCCNGCSKRGFCEYPKRYYNPEFAQNIHDFKLKDSRKSIILNDKEFEELDNIVSSGLKKKQSMHHIFSSNVLPVGERTGYNYLNKGYLSANLLDTHRILRRKPKTRSKPTNSKILTQLKEGRHYEDYEKYIAEHPEETLSQWDTVIGKQGGKVLLSIIIVKIQFHFYFLLPDKKAESVVNKLNQIQDLIGTENYKKLFGFALTDNGPEFSDINGMIADSNGEIRTNLFFCHTYASYEKGSCEKSHEILRYKLPDGCSFNGLNDEDMSIIMSHINSYKRKSIDSSSPIELFYAMFGRDILNKLGIKLIKPNNVDLTPYETR